MKKFLIGSLGAVLVLGGVGWTMRTDIILYGMSKAAKARTPVGDYQEVIWETGPAEAEKPIADRPPNIILILADDMGFNDVSVNGGGIAAGTLETPNINAIAEQGVHFTRGHSSSAVCAISRAALLTGRYSTRFGFEFTPAPDGMGRILGLFDAEQDRLRHNKFDPAGDAAGDAASNQLTYAQKGLPTSEITIAEVLQEEGYHTMHIGKWHLGSTPEFMPRQQGFDESILMRGLLFLPEDDPEVVNAKQDFDPIDQFLWATGQYAASYNEGPAFAPKGYLTDYYTNEAVKAINANANRPFFLYLAHWGIHSPLQASKADYDALSHIEDHRERVYAAMARAVDRSVGDVMQALEDNGIAGNTLVIFTSDNGGAHYIGLPDINKPFRGWKLTFFEGGTRVPFMAKWPGHIEAGTAFDAPISHMDIMPTVVAAASGSMPTDRTIDGVNLLPFLSGEETGAPHKVLFWREGYYQAVMTGGWKLQVSDDPDTEWLYHLAEDPTEQVNLASAQPGKVAELQALLDAHNAEQAEPLWPAGGALSVTIDKDLSQKEEEGEDYIYWPN